jgi:hypothetical protein
MGQRFQLDRNQKQEVILELSSFVSAFWNEDLYIKN